MSFASFFRHRALLLSCCALWCGRADAHTLPDRNVRQDSTRVVALLDSAYRMLNRDNDMAAGYVRKAMQVARHCGFTKGIISSDIVYTDVLISQGRYREAYKVASATVELSRKLGNERYLARAYTARGATGIMLGHFQMAANNLLDAAAIIDRKGTPLQVQQSLNLLSIIFTELKDKHKSLGYALKAEKLGLTNRHPGTDLMTLMQLARGRALNGQAALADRLFEKLLVKAKQLKDTLNTTYTYIYWAELAIGQKKYRRALELYTMAHQEAVRTGYPDFLIYANGGLAHVWFGLRDLDKASDYLQQGIDHARRAGSENMLRELLLLGAQVREQQHKLVEALAFRKEYEALNSKLLNLDLQQNIHRLEAVFQNSVKEREIADQKLLIANNQLKINRQNNYIVLAVLLACTLGVSTLLVYLWYRNKQKITEKNLFLLEKEKEVQILKAMISGEETERSRLAKDLHDGVGGLLSATKMHLSVLGNDTGPTSVQQHLSHTVAMLDSASNEIRMIAHNLAPDLLVKLGLAKALSAYFSKLQNPGFRINYLKIGTVPRMEANFELLLYRTVQELIHNVIKHARCEEALVQLSFHEDVLSITVEDNGPGFRGAQEGHGLSSLRARIAAVNGYMEIESSGTGGTTVFTEFDITPYIIRTYDTHYYRHS
ncbi:histidine kinase [Pedobacter sp. JY14-1]|uniref:tetratricopeptide repeat-containing sensor histidine kinase n=1 Tax=Pedobacter sp. JY14-1 TaxID=3034151 RepID=UPI0023E2B461|nr:histidine kinase [Pedobacter sp. JY14-1]